LPRHHSERLGHMLGELGNPFEPPQARTGVVTAIFSAATSSSVAAAVGHIFATLSNGNIFSWRCGAGKQAHAGSLS
jgi:hypothetical protein